MHAARSRGHASRVSLDAKAAAKAATAGDASTSPDERATQAWLHHFCYIAETRKDSTATGTYLDKVPTKYQQAVLDYW